MEGALDSSSSSSSSSCSASFRQHKGGMATIAAADKMIAVVGAGVSGLVCASRLAEQGFSVMVFDSGRGPGGRMSQRRERSTDGKMYYFDHGTQYITAKDTVVQKFIEKWEEMGIVAEWKGKFGTYDASSKIFIEDSDLAKKRYVGVPGMNAICQALSQLPGVESRFGLTVTNMEWEKEHRRWTVSGKDGQELGRFQAIIATDKNMASPRFSIQNKVPPPLARVPSLVEKVAGVTSSSSFAIMLAFPERLSSIPYDGFSINGSEVLAWASRDTSKPKRGELSAGECWVLQSTPEYAQEIINSTGLGKLSDDVLANIANSCFEHFKGIGDMPPPVFAKAHRWGSAFPKTFIAKEERCLVDQDMCIAVCGDFCVGPNVESAILSGVAAAEKIQSILAVDAKL